MTVGERLRSAREGKGFSRRELGVLVGIHRNTVMRAEAGAHQLGADSLAKWAQATGVSADELLGIGSHGGHGDGERNGCTDAQRANGHPEAAE